MLKFILIIFILFFFTNPSFSYLGPGVGGGIIAATLGVIIAILAAIFGLIWFPLKRFFQSYLQQDNHYEKSSILTF